ncbi:hypothetical protein [Flavilitoribacter nigricans]|uniref:DUF3619 family protein n=1 Tax=Flavilitoribacter nigricans (strain ATCC 23147 / DSM 23189 / NBRC 102662 / NCIMB 1420 / SS-2) TaxID=1122177 RepID=A0A2D0N688_FLAN2|nr:hypothetical protein [Flavilitoribacter nigricans]PHN03896.1 hypothetical protein CRP01_23775 [Flavilitoribacter nigricans DSM 23189 = NBRC 102662]
MGNEKNKRSVREELESIAPNLARLREQNSPPEVPPGYFDQLSDEVFRRIQREEAAARDVPAAPPVWQQWWQGLSSLFQRPAYALALAGVAILLVTISVFNRSEVADTTPDIAMTDEDINDYIDYHIDDFDLDLLAEEMAEEPGSAPLLMEEDSLDGELMEEYFDELLDEIDLEDLL